MPAARNLSERLLCLKNRCVPARKQHEQKLLRILISFHERYTAAGLDTLAAMIRKECLCSRNTVHWLMKLYNIHSIRKRAFKITTNSKHNYAVSPNLLKRDFAADKPNQKWVGDINYIPTDEGWLYAAIVKGLCRANCLWATSFFRQCIIPAEAHFQANRGINAVGFSKLTKYCGSFHFLELFCVYFYWDGTIGSADWGFKKIV